MKASNIISLIILVTLSGCKPNTKEIQTQQVQNTPLLKGEISITGADALYPLMEVCAKEFMKQHPGLQIIVTNGGTGRGIQQLLKGETDLAMVSRELTSDEESLGLWFFPVTKEAVFPIISVKNPYIARIREQGISRNTLKVLYRGDSTITWGGVLSLESREKVLVHTRSDSSGAAVVWSKYLAIRDAELAGIKVSGDNGMVQAIRNEPFSLGYCNAHYAYDFTKKALHEGIEVIPLDLNNNGKIDKNEEFCETLCQSSRTAYMGKYPVHLCREIALVSNGKPSDKNIIEFVRWIYTEGQDAAKQIGYAELRNCIAEDYLYLLDHTIFK